jgi:hypothetical protein
MEKKTLLKTAVVILILAVAVTGYLILSDKTAEPADRVLVKTRQQTDGMFFTKAVDRIPARAAIVAPKVENDTITVGVSADRNELNFGVVIQNMSVTKFLNIENKDVAVKECVVSYGDIGPLINVPENSFVLSTGESKAVTLHFSGSELGNYTGEVDVITKKPKFGFMEFLLPYVAC